MNNIPVFIGRFHPLLVHLPIGILLLAVLFQFLSLRPRFAPLRAALPLIWLIGAAGAILSCVSGYLLSQNGGYDEAILSLHQWLGIATAVLALAGYFFSKNSRSRKWQLVAGAIVLVLLTGAGHYGGTLTHGADFLTAPAQENGEGPKKLITDVNEANAYQDIIEPILQRKCTGCHNAGKKKGGLQLHTPELMMKGGKTGPALLAGDPEKSELIQRIQLPVSDEAHMAPKGKPQITAQELQLLTWWIREGASFTAKVKELKAGEKERTLLTALQGGTGMEQEEKNIPDNDVPAAPVPPASEKDMDAVKATGALLMPVSASGNYLSLSCLNAPGFADAKLKLLAPVSQQLVFLHLDGTEITDAGLKEIPAMPHLVRIGLAFTAITDIGLKELTKFPSLKYINLHGTNVSAKGLSALKGMSSLREITVFQTKVSLEEVQLLTKVLPGVSIEAGGYTLPKLASDTERLSAPYKKN
ncbi:MAG: c-type cytochrome domain-containing protein [Chitinophagaceae bacterium]